MKSDIIYKIGLMGRIVLTYPFLMLVSVIVVFAILGTPEYLAAQKARDAKRNVPLSDEARLSRLFATPTQVRWMSDGTLHLMGLTTKKNRREILDKNGKRIWEGRRDADDCPDKHLGFSYQLRLRTNEMVSPELFRKLEGIEPFGMVGDIPIQDSQGGITRFETWRYDCSAEVFHRYDADGRYGGSLGANGFVDTKHEAQALGLFRMGFPIGAYRHMVYWITDRTIYELNLKQRSVAPLVSGDSPIISLDQGGIGVGLHAATEDGMHHIINYNAKTRTPEVLSFPIRDANGNKLKGFMARDGKKGPFYLYERHRGEYFDLVDGETYAEVLYRVGSDGSAEELNREEWTYVQPPLYGRRVPLFVQAITTVSPVWLQIFPEPRHQRFPLIARELRENGIRNSVLEFVDECAGQNVAGWLLFTVLLLAIGIRTKGFNGWPTVGWAFFVLFFGFPALLVWMAIAPRTYVRCRACGKRTRVHEESCRRCEGTIPSEQTLLIHNPLEVHQ